MSAQRGLHGHPLDEAVTRSAATELVGTFVLVLAIVTTAVAATAGTPIAGTPYGSVAIPLAGGAALVVGVAALGHLSGAHFNPAVTVALAVAGRFPWRTVPAYLIAQLAGSVLAALAAWGIGGSRARDAAALGATAPADGVSGVRVLLVEALVTFILVLVVVAVATDERLPAGAAGLAIGTALAVAILISGPITGAGVNPARALGPMLVSGRLTDWWAYLIGPLLGGIVATTVYHGFLAPAVPAPDARPRPVGRG